MSYPEQDLPPPGWTGTRSPSRTQAEQEGDAPEEHRPNPQELAQDLGRDPLPNKHEDTGGCPGGSPGRTFDTIVTLEPGAGHGACAPEPVGAKDHRPGEFEQPSREEPTRREFGDWAG